MTVCNNLLLCSKRFHSFSIDTRFKFSSRAPKPRRSWEFNVPPAGTHYAIYYANYGCGAATRAFPMQMHREWHVEMKLHQLPLHAASTRVSSSEDNPLTSRVSRFPTVYLPRLRSEKGVR